MDIESALCSFIFVFYSFNIQLMLFRLFYTIVRAAKDTKRRVKFPAGGFFADLCRSSTTGPIFFEGIIGGG